MKYSMTGGALPKRAVGYRFHPTDEELVNFLEWKVLGYDDKHIPIALINICHWEPWDLPGQSKPETNDNVWYFLCPRDYKYRNSNRSNRTTKAGYWKPTGNPRDVLARRSKKLIGTKRTLVFHLGRPNNGVKTEWIMHEYQLPVKGDFVLCKLKCKADKKVKKGKPNILTTQNSNEMTATSACGDTGNQTPNTTTAATSTYEIGESSCLMDNSDSNCENQNPDKEYSEVGDWSPTMASPYDSGNQNSNEIGAMSTCDKGKLSPLIFSGFQYQNPDKTTYISSPEEGRWSPSDWELENQYQNTGILTQVQGDWSLDTAFDSENDVADASFPEEMVRQKVTELEAVLVPEESHV